MAKCSLSKEALRTLAQLSGLELTDEALDEILPQVQQTREAVRELDALDLEGVAPALLFKPSQE